MSRARKALDKARTQAFEALRQACDFVRQGDWLQDHLSDATLRAVEGLVKLVDRRLIAAHDWSLTPGRYVGVAPEEQDEDLDFEEALPAIHIDLKGLNEEAAELAARIARNFEELGA
jgi:type I restriction enzyme M protein